MRVIFVLCAIFLAGCSEMTWMKDGATRANFDQDVFDCTQRVVTMYGGYTQMGIGHAIMARQDNIRCMESKGYRQMSTTELRAVGR